MTSLYRAPVPDGWWPTIAPDGRHLAYGNATIRVAVLATGQTIVVGPGMHPQWIDTTTVTYWNSTRFIAQEADGWRPHPAQEGALGAGNTTVARDGHWAVWLANQSRLVFDGRRLANPSRLVFDGRIVATGTGGAIDTAGGRLIYSNAQGTTLTLLGGPTFLPAQAPHVVKFRGPYVSYGYFGPVRVLNVDTGADIDATVTPWSKESPGIVVAVEGVPWIVTATEDPRTKKGCVLARPLGARDVITVPGDVTWLDVLVMGRTLIIAGSGSRGELSCVSISADAPRAVLSTVPVPSLPAPAPSTIAQVGRPAIWAYWKPVDLLAPCNAVVIEQQADLALTHTSRPLIILRPMLPSCWQYWDRVLAVLIHEEGGQAAVEAQARLAILAMQAAGVPKRDVMTYTGKNLHPSAKGVDIHGIQAYLAPDTPNPAQVMGRLIRTAAGQFGPKQKLVLHGQAYDRRTYNDPTRRPANMSEGWTDIEGLKALQTVYPACLKADSRMVGCVWFHDGQRQGGTRDYPELIPYHARCVSVTPGPPAIPVIVVPPPPPDPDPPVDDEEEPPVPTPVKFPPMSDAERAEVATMIETIYDTIYPDRAQRQTRVDPLGYGRWPVDYLVARARGADHAGGIKTMRAALFSAAGVPDPDPS